MKFYQQIPFFRLILPFVIGIIVAAFLPIHIKWWWVGFVISASISILLGGLKPLAKNYGLRWVYGSVLTITLFISGYMLTIGNTQIFSEEHFANRVENKTWLQVRVTDPVEEKARSFKVSIEVESYRDTSGWHSCKGKAITYFQKSDSVAKIKYGDELLVNSQLSEVEPPGNPGQFNYKRYLAFHNIYHQGFVHSNDWIQTGINKGNPIFIWSNNLRLYLLDIFQKYGLQGNEYAVASALILGYKGALEDELMRAYSSAGATHVLAVSGLHVGIIYVIINNLLLFLDRKKVGRILKAFLLIGFLWFYALLTGLSPSVMRAATMFSFIVIAKATNRNTNIYNTLAVSAFFLLLFNPYLIMEVGFQLSYLAVLGIVYLQPKIYAWWEPNNWLLDKIWSLTAVSIAAQVATLPLGLLYFHQFPNYFFISNLVVIPLATLIVYAGILLFFVSAIPILATYVAKGLYWIIWGMNYCVQFIESIPYSLTEGLTINITETWMIYLIIITTLIFFHYKRYKYLMVAMSSMLLLVSYQLFQGATQISQQKFVVYQVPKTTAFEFIEGQNSYLISDSTLINNDDQLLFNIKHLWWETGATSNSLINISDTTRGKINKISDNYFVFNNTTIALIDDQTQKHQTQLEVDYVIVSNLKYLDLELLEKEYKFKTLIIDSSNPKWLAEKWVTKANEIGLDIYSVPNQGAFVANL